MLLFTRFPCDAFVPLQSRESHHKRAQEISCPLRVISPAKVRLRSLKGRAYKNMQSAGNLRCATCMSGVPPFELKPPQLSLLPQMYFFWGTPRNHFRHPESSAFTRCAKKATNKPHTDTGVRLLLPFSCRAS